jgi:hypothetical protein
MGYDRREKGRERLSKEREREGETDSEEKGRERLSKRRKRRVRGNPSFYCTLPTRKAGYQALAKWLLGIMRSLDKEENSWTNRWSSEEFK